MTVTIKGSLKNILNHISDIIIVIDVANYRILSCNSAFLKNFSLSEHEAIGRTCHEVTHRQNEPCKAPEVCPMQISLETGKSATVEHIHYGKNDEPIYVEISTHPIKSNSGKVKNVIHVSKDITERKIAEENIRDTLQKLEKALSSTTQVIASTVEMRDPYTAGHQKRVANLAHAIATEMGLPREQTDGIKIAGVIHDIGKLSIPSEILSKTSKLSKIEMSLIKNHPRAGYDIIKEIDFPWPLAKIILQHHERMNGTGYPCGLSDKDILLEARILAIADVVEAMASHRPYRPAIRIDEVLKTISLDKGTLYDTQVANACLKIFATKRFEF